MSEFTFAEVEKPATVRTTAPNPFREAVESLKGTDKALSFTVKADGPDARNVKTISRQLRECGKPVDVTVRQRREYDAKKKEVTFTFWTTDRITHADSAEANGGK